MSEGNSAVVGAELTAVVKAVKARKPSVSLDKFNEAVIAGSKAGQTPAQVAAGLGMEIASFNQRLVGLRKLAAANGLKVPALADGRTGNSGNKGGNSEMKNSVLAALRNAGTVVDETADAPAESAEPVATADAPAE